MSALGFRLELEKLINRESMENGSDTPDFVLCLYLMDCLRAFDRAVEARERHYGRASGSVKPSTPETSPAPELEPIHVAGPGTPIIGHRVKESPAARPCVWRDGCKHPSVCDKQDVCVPGGEQTDGPDPGRACSGYEAADACMAKVREHFDQRRPADDICPTTGLLHQDGRHCIYCYIGNL